MTDKPLPAIAPCPCGRAPLLHEMWYVSCRCGWTGPMRSTAHAAIKLWNAAWNRRAPVDVDAAERSGMEAVRLALYWLESRPMNGAEFVIKTAMDVLRNAVIERGEVLPKRKAGKRGGR